MALCQASPIDTLVVDERGPDGELRVTLTLIPGLDHPTVRAVLTALGERIATDGEVRARIDAITFALR